MPWRWQGPRPRVEEAAVRFAVCFGLLCQPVSIYAVCLGCCLSSLRRVHGGRMRIPSASKILQTQDLKAMQVWYHPEQLQSARRSASCTGGAALVQSGCRGTLWRIAGSEQLSQDVGVLDSRKSAPSKNTYPPMDAGVCLTSITWRTSPAGWTALNLCRQQRC